MPNLHSLANQFHDLTKTAGELKVPDKLLQEVSDYIVAAYCSQLTDELENRLSILKERETDQWEKPDLKPIYFLRGFLRSKFDPDKNYDVGHNFVIPISELPYFDKTGKGSVRFIALFIPNEVKAESISKAEPWNGLWIPSKSDNNIPSYDGLFLGRLFIYRDIKDHLIKIIKDPAILKNLIEHVKSTTKHELQHFIQTALGKIKDLKRPGLPSKNISDNNFDPNGNPKNPNQAYLDHPSRDIEFYTRLSEEISRFNRYKTNLPLALHQSYFKAWTAQISMKEFISEIIQYLKSLPQNKNKKEFNLHDDIYDGPIKDSLRAIHTGNDGIFPALKIKYPEKYKKLVKEFIKAIT